MTVVKTEKCVEHFYVQGIICFIFVFNRIRQAASRLSDGPRPYPGAPDGRAHSKKQPGHHLVAYITRLFTAGAAARSPAEHASNLPAAQTQHGSVRER